jgi:hypothetical protein
VETVRLQLKEPPLQWIQEPPQQEDLEWLKHEAEEESPYDKLRLRRRLWEGYRAGTVRLVCKTCGSAKVIILHEANRPCPDIWKTWGRIFQLYGREARPWRVGLFAAPIPRTLPAPGQPVGPEHVNGGYTIPCKQDRIIIYREEECTRVLLHELFHGACSDRLASLPHMEAETESWAEWVLVALASEGNLERALALMKKQIRWMSAQHRVLRAFYNVLKPEDFAWRYTLGREHAYQRLGLHVPISRGISRVTSSRLTAPALEL